MRNGILFKDLCKSIQFNSDFTRHVSRQILVYEHPYKITLIKAVSNYRPNVPYHCKLLVKDHNGVPVTNRLITAKTDAGEERSTKTDSQGIATLDLPMPDAADAVDISVSILPIRFVDHTDHCFYIRLPLKTGTTKMFIV